VAPRSDKGNNQPRASRANTSLRFMKFHPGTSHHLLTATMPDVPRVVAHTRPVAVADRWCSGGDQWRQSGGVVARGREGRARAGG
jgi:hypothetical protein